MSNIKIYKERNSMILQIDIMATILVAALCAFLKIIQVFTFFDDETGLILKTQSSDILGNTSLILFLIVILINIKTAFDMKNVLQRTTVKMKPKTGYFLFLTALLFFLQGIFDISNHFVLFRKTTENFHLTGTDFVMNKILNSFPIIIDIFSIISAICFCLIAYKKIKNKKISFALYIIPTLWALLVIVNSILSVTTSVCMQSFEQRIILITLTLAFVYFVVSSECEFEEKRKSFIPMFFKISFYAVTICIALPYVIAEIIIKGKQCDNTPYFAILGLGLYSFSICMQYFIRSINMKKSFSENFQKI